MSSLPEIQTGYTPISNLLFMSYLPGIINTAVDAGIFQSLYENNKDIDGLAQALETDNAITNALCEVLMAVDLLEMTGKDYRLTPVSREFLQAGSPVNQIMDIQKHSGSKGPFDNLLAALKGERQEFNSRQWADKKAALGMEQGAKAGAIQNVVSFVTDLQGFKGCRKMCDLAGNIGHYSAGICGANPTLHAHVYDLPEVAAMAPGLRKEEHAGRIRFHDCDIMGEADFGNGYDLFFISHFLYGFGAAHSLAPFLRKVNQAMVKGGIFVSHHISDKMDNEMVLTMKIVELMTRAMGYPTHTLPLGTLKEALAKAGFADFIVREPDLKLPFPATLLAAKKTKDL